MMEDAIRNFHTQFAFVPEIKNKKAYRPKKKFLVCGMGGSHLAADLLQIFDPSLDVVVWKNYGLPKLRDLKDRLVVLCSYSGNTEEILEGFREARRKKLPMGVVAVGGKLIALAKQHGIPYVQVPDTGIQPRSATGFMCVGLLKLLGREDLLRRAATLGRTLKPGAYEKTGRDLARRLRGKVPLVYASGENWALAEIWKIRFNETGKIPAFWNVLPEANHNEMTSFDVVPGTLALSRNFHFILLEDVSDHAQNRKRMNVMAKLLRDRGFGVEIVVMREKEIFKKTFGSLLVGDWAALHLSKYYKTESEQVPMVEEFKKLI